MTIRPHIFLIDPPTFPKGILSLSFPAIKSTIPSHYKVSHIDLNIEDFSSQQIQVLKDRKCAFAGIKVSGQNYKYAIELTKKLKRFDPSVIVIWGGEYPTLQSKIASEYADVVIIGAFENVAANLFLDLEKNAIKNLYEGRQDYNCSKIYPPDYSIVKNKKKYLQTMGLPLETSRGCDKKCTFCMVHTMQPLYNFKTKEQLKKELIPLTGCFVNVVDYNIGVDKDHLNNLTEVFKDSEISGWMGEMCLETLDDEDLLIKLAKSRCRIIYCGLESIDNISLRSVNKAKTNNIDNYSRIIKKAQKYGIQIAAGIIIGLEGSDKKQIDETFKFYSDLGIAYVKITFLTYNPGTKVYESMKRVGTYTTEDHHLFDGNHLVFLPHGVDEKEIMNALKANIRTFYALKAVFRRIRNSGLKGAAFREILYFNIGYRDAYLKWLKFNVFDGNGFDRLMEEKFTKSLLVSFADWSINRVRRKRLYNDVK